MNSEFSLADLEGRTFAAIDLGSNSFHLVVARLDHGVLTVIDRHKEMVRLAEGVRESGKLRPEVRDRALWCLERFGERLRQIPAANVRAIGTNAMRRMKDGWKFLSKAEKRLGHDIGIVSGQEEARLIYLGVAHGISERGNQRLVIDIGGGSTEFIIGRDYEPIILESLYFGCVGMTQRFFRDGKITRKRWNKAKAAVAVELQRITASFKACHWQEALGSSGTMRAFRNVVLANGWSERGITLKSAMQLRDHLIAAGHSDQLALDGLSERRRPVFAGGAVIVETCLEELAIDQLIVADYAMREGILYDMLGRIMHSDPREGAVLSLQSRYSVDKDQAERVRACAMALFEQVATDWRLSENAGSLLGWAAMLHELGLALSHHGYHRHGAYVIANADLPGFSKQEQSVLAVLIGTHRRKPDIALFDDLLPRIRGDVIHLALLLRLAVLLMRTRTARARVDLRVAIRPGSVELQLPAGTGESHPLTLLDLQAEQTHFRRLGVSLKLKVQ